MRVMIALTVMVWSLWIGFASAEPPELILAIDSSQKSRVGVLLKETPSDLTFRDIRDGMEVRTPKSVLKKLERRISDDTAIRVAGLPAVVAWHVAENATRETSVGKIASVSQNVIYLTLGSESGVETGQRLDVYRKKNEIKDPDTGKVIAVERPKIGLLEITEVNKEFSKARAVSALEIALQTGDEVEPQREKFQVAVLPFRSEEGELTDVAAGLAEDLTTQLARQEITVLERSALDKVLVELAIQNTVLFEPENVKKLGQLAGASTIVTGKIVTKGKLGTAYARLIDVRSGKILYAASGTMSLANAKVVGESGEKKGMSSKSDSTVKRRPVPRGAFQSDVVEFTDNAPAGAIFKLARNGTPIFPDRNYVLSTVPKEISGGALLWRDSEKANTWLEPSIIAAQGDCTAYAMIRWKHLGKVDVDEVTLTKLVGEGWEEVDVRVATSFPNGGDWNWKLLKKELSEGDVILQLQTVNWGKNPVLFIFK
ncbi:FlgO family outer membrane protein [Planctellipticum variicoloris]|uniref:FlgO family outer membrane protein n=1 Tax=Planctellipticum variicoloris TaxID=3064265 RepID=UPI003013F145|nr:CsgG/HfaB family protein [Planctomycetaceae bacterium SH412]